MATNSGFGGIAARPVCRSEALCPDHFLLIAFCATPDMIFVRSKYTRYTNWALGHL